MFYSNLLQKTICTLAILSILGECAVIPEFDMASPKDKSPEVAHKWESISRIKSKAGPNDDSPRDRLMKAVGKVPKTPQNWPSIVAGQVQSSASLDMPKKERVPQKAVKDVDMTRSKKPLSVKSTAGHVGYEERHRFSGIPFDQLLDATKVSVSQVDLDGPGKAFESDGDDDDGDDGSSSDDDSDDDEDEGDDDDEDEDFNEGEEEEDDALGDPNETDVPNKGERRQGSIHWDVFQHINADTVPEFQEPRSHINWQSSSRSKVAGAVTGSGNTRPEINWQSSSKRKTVGGPEIERPHRRISGKSSSRSKAAAKFAGQEPKKDIHWQASSKSKAADASFAPKPANDISWQVTSRSKAVDLLGAQNPHDQHEVQTMALASKREVSEADDYPEAASSTVKTLHREKEAI
ncbi:hypothetical protein JCM33374_g3529 [Metschnikowia sp. JCM 33374]|nr:hypothetical protein JCM33374_g3529 [Metschnikowia sp. JCM 33374]